MIEGGRTRMSALIVEDDHTLSAIGAEFLAELDLDVQQFRTAEDAIERLQALGGSVAVLLADIRLPGAMDGLSLARRVSVLWPSVSLIVTSGGPEPDDMPDRCVFVPKPWRGLDIVAAAERFARDDHTVHSIRL